ncbi:hypothetical protein AK830_g12147, partial [Neonectria ditissima]
RAAGGRQRPHLGRRRRAGGPVARGVAARPRGLHVRALAPAAVVRVPHARDVRAAAGVYPADGAAEGGAAPAVDRRYSVKASRPDVRDAIIQHMDWSRFLELRAVTAGSLCVAWPRTDARAVFECVDGKNYRLSGVFEQHLRDSRNWTVGAGADEVFPFLKPVCRRAP